MTRREEGEGVCGKGRGGGGINSMVTIKAFKQLPHVNS
jgi:hypothetical protein